MLGGVAPVGVVITNDPWVIAVVPDSDGDMTIRAFNEEFSPDVDAVEHTFLLGEEGGESVALYSGAILHTCQTEGGGDCEEYSTVLGEVGEEDIPDAVRDPVEDVIVERIEVPDEEDPDDLPDSSGGVEIPITDPNEEDA